MTAVALLSGGKDSIYAMMSSPHTVACIATMVSNKETHSYMF